MNIKSSATRLQDRFRNSTIGTAVCYGNNCYGLDYTRQELARNEEMIRQLNTKNTVLKNELERRRDKVASFDGSRNKQVNILGYITIMLLIVSIVASNIPCDATKNVCYYGTHVFPSLVYMLSGTLLMYTLSTWYVNREF